MLQRMLLSGGASAPAGPFWIGLLGGSGYDDGYGVAVDGAGNMYVAGRSYTTGDGGQVAKYNASGVLQWQRRLAGISSLYAVAVNASGDVFVTGDGASRIPLAKYNTSGTLQWQYELYSPTGSTAIGEGITVDASGNIYVSGQYYNGSNYDYVLIKFNSSGTIQWQKGFGGTQDQGAFSVAVNAAGDVWVHGKILASQTITVKYNSSGTVQWQRTLAGSTGTTGYGCAVGSDDSVYVCGTAGTTARYYVAKYTSAGGLSWQRMLSNAFSATSVALDSSDNVYVCGYSTSVGGEIVVAKYSPSGTLQWQRSLGGSVNEYGEGIAVSGENLYVCGRSAPGSSNYFMFAKLPTDGSKTGTYSVGSYSVTYQASSFTESAASMTAATSGYSSSNTAMDPYTGTYTDAASTLTSSVTTL